MEPKGLLKILRFKKKQLQAVSTAPWHSLAQSLPHALFVLNRELIVVYANPRSEELFNTSALVGLPVLNVTLSHGIESLASQCIAQNKPFSNEFSLRGKSEFITQVRVWPDPMEKEWTYVLIEDISELRRLETVRKDFVANVSHELRTPLTNIRAMTETLADCGPEDAAIFNRFQQQIVSEVDRLSNIVGDLLTLGVAESLMPEIEPIDLNTLCYDIIEQLTPQSEVKGLELTYQLPPSLVIQANPTQIAQVIINLLDNAVNYTNSGSIKVLLTQENGFAKLTISDTGIGISSEQIGRIFERFYRVDKGRSRYGGGTGLGLSIVKNIVESHGGTIQVESMLNRGSTFTLMLPIQPRN